MVIYQILTVLILFLVLASGMRGKLYRQLVLFSARAWTDQHQESHIRVHGNCGKGIAAIC